MSQYNNIVITPNIGVSSNPNIKFSGIGNTTIKLEYYDTNNSSLAVQSEDKLLFSFTNTDEENPDLIYAINDADGTTALSVSNSGITSISNLQASLIQTPLVNHLATGAASTTKITTKHYGTDGGYLAFESGISTSHIFSIGATEENNEVYVINDNDANPVLTVYDSGETGLIRASFASTNVGAASTQKMEISAVSRDNGLLEITNYGGNQLFSVSNNQSESAFSVYRYANYENLSITSFENRNLFSVSPLGIVTTYGELRVGTSNTIADSSVYNELYGRLNVRAPFSTATEYVSIVPKFSDKGALSFEAPVGTALTDRGTQIFSISNNVDSSIFRVNDLNRQPIFEASASGNAGIGTTNPSVRFEVVGSTRVTSSGSTAGEQIDIRHYRNIADQSRNYTGIGLINNRGAISFDSPTGYSTNGIQLFPASLFAITNDPTGNIFSVSGYKYFSGSGVPAIDVTQSGRVGIGTTNPITDFEIRRDSYVTGNVQIQNRIIFSNGLNPASTSYVSILPYTSSLGPSFPTRGSIVFQGDIEQNTLNGRQLVTILNDNSTLFNVSRELGMSSTRPAPVGTRLIESVLDISSSGTIGIGGTTNVSNRVEINSRNELVSSVVASASSIGISTTIIGINTSGITVGLEIQEYTGVIAAGTTVISIGSAQIGIGRTTLNNFIRSNTVLTFGSRTNERVVAITNAGFVGLGVISPTAKLDVNGNVRISGIATIGLGSTSSPTVNSTMSFELTNNTTLTVRVRGTDGTVRTGIITLS